MRFFSSKKFKPGDLICGLKSMRFRYINYTNFFEANYGPAFIEEYQITSKERSRINKCYYRNAHFCNTVVNHPKYRTASVDPHLLVKGRATSQWYIDKPININRKSKAALNWLSQYKKNYNLIHFILDDINIEQVIKKNNIADCVFKDFDELLLYKINEAKANNLATKDIDQLQYDQSYNNESYKSRDIIGSELRWIYRHREDPNVKKSVRFWYAFKPCCAPWDPRFDIVTKSGMADLWKLYKPKKEFGPRYLPLPIT